MSMIPVESLQLIGSLAVKAAEPKVIEVPNDRHFKHVVIDGEAHAIAIPPVPRSHIVETLDDIAALAFQSVKDGESPEVWVSQEAVELRFSRKLRTENAHLKLSLTDTFRAVYAMRDKTYEHREFVRLLRFDLGRVTELKGLLDAVRKIDAITGSSTTSNVQHASRGFGQSVDAAVKGSAPIPEEVVIGVQVYSCLESKIAIRCLVEVDPARPTFKLSPLPDEIEIAVEIATHGIASKIAKDLADCEVDVCVFRGKP